MFRWLDQKTGLLPEREGLGSHEDLALEIEGKRQDEAHEERHLRHEEDKHLPNMLANLIPSQKTESEKKCPGRLGNLREYSRASS